MSNITMLLSNWIDTIYFLMKGKITSAPYLLKSTRIQIITSYKLQVLCIV
jgi:hypothetical protein